MLKTDRVQAELNDAAAGLPELRKKEIHTLAQENAPSQSWLIRALFDDSDSLLLVCDALSGTIQTANPRAMQTLGLTAANIGKTTFPHFAKKLDSGIGWQALIKALQHQSQITLEGEIEKKRGGTFAAEAKFSLLKAGRLSYVLISIEDLESQKRMSANERRFLRIIEAVPGAVFQYEHRADDTQKFLFISKGSQDLFGVEAEEVMKDFRQAWKLVHPEDAERLFRSIRMSAMQMTPWIHEFRAVLPGGELKWLRGSSVPECKKDGSFIFNGILIDITDKKIAEENLERKNVALRELLNQIEIEKKAIKDSVQTNVDNFLMPMVRKLQKKGTSFEDKQLDLLEKNLEDLTSSFGSNIGIKLGKLTPKEIEICSMIKNGLTAKEISTLLNTSSRTIETHRHSIRKKMGLSNKKINLTTFLKTL